MRNAEVTELETIAPEPPPLLDVANLRIDLPAADGLFQAVRGVRFTLQRQERLAIVGESGSGKSITMRALLGLIPHNARVTADHIRFEGEDILRASHRDLRRFRGRRIAMIVQDARQALTPVKTIGAQIAEMLRLHLKLSQRAARDRAVELLDEVRIRDASRVAGLYPHEVSGGMGQRAMIAMMLAGEPDLLIADEATSALDAIVQHHILELIDEQIAKRHMGLILISHDLDLVARHSDRVLVMYAGRAVETLEAHRLGQATHAYTRGLIACRPSLDHLGQDLPVLTRDPAWLS
jgi:peptide/nickel transport system ATP-binding protein